MTRTTRTVGSVLVVLAGLIAQSCGKDDTPPTAPDVSLDRRGPHDDNLFHPRPVQLFAAGCTVLPVVDAFRTVLGTLNPNVAGSFPGGRREINWDGVPAA